jgi:hypothetical protein
MPKSACCSGVIARRCAARTGATSQHVRRVDVELEPLAQVLAQHARRERTEALAILDLQIEHRLHARRARIAEDAAGTERARTELHAALEPADDPLRREQASSTLEQLVARQALVDRAQAAQRRLDGVVVERRPEVGAGGLAPSG